MKLKRIFAGALCLCLCASLWVGGLPAQATGTPAPAFVDIPDAAQAESAELLRLLGVVSGDGAGHFSPADRLTRAEFCTMAIAVRQETDKANAMMNYTFFNDVKGDHWARGFINYAARITVGDSGERLVVGDGNANFAPDKPIEFCEAVTMTIRLLGYSQKDVPSGGNWYTGYMTAAQEAGLLEGLTLTPSAYLTRGQAAVLFRNLLFADMKDGGATFFASLGGTEVKNVILLSTSATAADGTTGCLEVTENGKNTIHKTNHEPFDAALQGAKVDLMLDKDGRVISIRETTNFTRRVVTLGAHEATYITTAAGERITIPSTIDFYRGNEMTSYDKVYMDLKTGGRLSLVYNRTGSLEYAYLSGADATYEVATRLTAVYEAASPSPKTPLTVRVLGAELTVLESAVEELSAFTPGDRVSFLLTADGKVAGAAKPENNTKSTLVGVVQEGSTAASATVKPVLAMKDATGADVTFKGTASASVEKMKGELVILSSSQAKAMTLTQVSDTAVRGVLNVQNRTLGGEALADRVYLFERTAGGSPEPITWSQVTVNTVPASKISYAGADESGKVNVLVLCDVTGDGYSYGYLSFRTEEKTVPASGDLTESKYNEYYIDLNNSNGEKVPYRVLTSQNLRSNTPGGVVRDGNGWGSYVTLTEVKRVNRSAFNAEEMTVTVSGVSYPIAENVVCYNRSTKLWFEQGAAGLAAARAYGESLSVYYDKTPSEGGKVRMVVVG